jgi:ketosteroid isomerase-like protein
MKSHVRLFVVLHGLASKYMGDALIFYCTKLEIRGKQSYMIFNSLV